MSGRASVQNQIALLKTITYRHFTTPVTGHLAARGCPLPAERMTCIAGNFTSHCGYSTSVKNIFSTIARKVHSHSVCNRAAWIFCSFPLWLFSHLHKTSRPLNHTQHDLMRFEGRLNCKSHQADLF